MQDEGEARPTPTAAAVDRLLLGGGRRYTRAQVAELSGMPPDRFQRLWHALGFAEAAERDVVFTDNDVTALRTLADLVDAGFVAPGTEASFARALAQPLARLADWQTALLTGALARDRAGRPDGPDPAPGDVPPAAEALMTLLGGVQDYVWRRHLAAAVERAPTAPAAGEVRVLAVGFADLVGYTTRTRGMSGAELGDMVEDFEATAAEVVARGAGQVVKNVGDGVLFTAADPAAAAEIGLSLPERWAAGDRPPLRVGLAHGRVLTRLGDVYSSVVNLASRLTTVARAGSVLVDRELAARLQRHPRYRVVPLQRRSVRGFEDLQPWLVSRRSGDDEPPDGDPGPTADLPG
ncbi:adenylate/guanylate cyclase domain-containing protein [Modestobacter marinus]|uniref:adenylate/guanylate cyclase domain-containing protein n=1 Tax=Modestobacter marinus TaxID=477641 RepID=UPI001C93A11F|nr:adenylate/guanylate cyclase domain-containing protein [Modestobacter marinus]